MIPRRRSHARSPPGLPRRAAGRRGQGLKGLEFVGFDVNTVSPPHDTGGMTAFLAGTVMLECLYLACHAPSLAPGLKLPG